MVDSPRLEGDDAPPLPTRERQRLQTRRLILDVAHAEIARHGLADARVESIARRAGITRPTFYAHFPRKEDLLRALEAESQAHALAELERRLGTLSGPELVHAFVDTVLDLLEGAAPTLRRETFALLLREPERIDWHTHPLFGFLTRELARSQRAGDLPETPAPADLTRIVVNALFGFLVVESEPTEVRRQAAHQMLDLLLARPRQQR